MFKSKDVVIDKDNNRYKKLYRVVGIPLSDGWQKLPNVKSVAITKRQMTKRLATGISVVNTSSIGVEFYFVYLRSDKKHIRVEVCKKRNLSNAQKVADNIANYFGVEVVDYTNK